MQIDRLTDPDPKEIFMDPEGWFALKLANILKLQRYQKAQVVQIRYGYGTVHSTLYYRM